MTPHLLALSSTYANILVKKGFSTGSYEYRSGRLIPGYLQQNCNFLPEPGEAIIEFKDYVYSKTSKRIYNLPGKFVRRSEYEAEKAKTEEAEKRKP